MNLYEIKSEIEALFSKVDENGELPDDIAQQLERLAITEHEKIENTGLYIKNLLSDADAIKNEVDKLNERRQAMTNKAERLKNYLTDYMTANSKDKFSTSRIDLRFRKSEQVNIYQDIDLPDDLWRVKREPDKATIKKLLKAGESVPGAELVERQNLQIK